MADLRRVGDPAQVLVAPALRAGQRAREAEGLVDGDADAVVAAHANAVLLVALQAQATLGVLDEALQLPAAVELLDLLHVAQLRYARGDQAGRVGVEVADAG